MIPSFQEFWPKRSIQKLIQKSKSETDPGARLSHPGVFTIQHNSCTHLYRFYVEISGFLHFYLKVVSKCMTNLERCQCPTSGFLHFYGNCDWRTKNISCVSMPYFGLSPFLPNDAHVFVYSKGLCQCPTSGFLHFYLLSRRFAGNLSAVSMPYFGLSPFLLTRAGIQCIRSKCVNALLRAFSISTPILNQFNHI